jgi:hypothetical protein
MVEPSVPGRLSTNDPLYLYDQLLYIQNQDLTDTASLDSAYNILAYWDPFFEEGVIAAVEYFNDDRNKDNYAYNLLVNALTVNTYSEVLNKYYIEYCIEDGLIDFARNRLEFMRAHMNGEGFEGYFNAINREISRKEADMNAWGS